MKARTINGGLQTVLQTAGREPSPSSIELAAPMRVTPSGLYHAYRFAATFTYIDAMIIDIPILDETVRDQMRSTDDIGDRLTRVETFVKDYLDRAWDPLADKAVGFDWLDLSEELKKEVETIRWKLFKQAIQTATEADNGFRAGDESSSHIVFRARPPIVQTWERGCRITLKPVQSTVDSSSDRHGCPGTLPKAAKAARSRPLLARNRQDTKKHEGPS